MLHKDKILSLRDLALEHLPKVREQRDLMSKHGRLLALQVVAGGPLKTFYNPASTAIEKRAAALLDLVHQHPDTTTEGLYPAECEMGAALQAVLLSDARKMQPAIEAAMLEDARLLCRIAGKPVPVWMAGSELQPAPVVTASNEPAIPKNQRPDLLTPLIEKAQRGETDVFSAAVIWPKLCDMAECKTTPFIGKTESGLQWIDANDSPQFLTKDALGDRLRRQKKAAIERGKPR
jgi:hypothetical protein